jgi:hypothetical protein
MATGMDEAARPRQGEITMNHAPGSDGVGSPESAPLEMVDISLDFRDLIGAHIRRLLARQTELAVSVVMVELGRHRVLGVWLDPGMPSLKQPAKAAVFAGELTITLGADCWREYEVDPMIRGHRIKQLLRSESQALLMVTFWNGAILAMSPLTAEKFSVHHPAFCKPECPHYGIAIKDTREEIDRHAAEIPEGG